MYEIVSKYVKGCVLCAISTPRNRKLGLYPQLLIPSQPWESVSMYFLGGLPMYKIVHDYLYVIVYMFNKMFILIPCKKQVTAKQIA